MKIAPTKLAGCFVLTPTVFSDERGSFFESFNQQAFLEKTGIEASFVQDNQSISQRGVVRGLHFQKGAFSQAKLVRVIKGSVLDVAVDLRKNSTTFGQHFSCILSEEKNTQLFVPRGFAHGFSVLENDTIFSYKCDNYYNLASESGIIYNDPQLDIDWMLPESEMVVSEKDRRLKMLKEVI
ncbi:MAG: dTDP-4-dehydrorhamnose 3,5-epimerase [Polaribacter sp.]|nr:dTDP-4-dehydrorhamnose 3,5-epimerase [Polaribacter sp.]